MKKLLLLLAVLSFAGQAQIQFLRGDSTSRPTLSIGQPALDTNLSVNANTLWIGTAQGNRPMGGDGIRWGTLMYGTSTAGTDSFAVTIPHGPYAYSTGMTLRFKADVANTGAAYLNVNSRGWKQITKDGATALSGGEIVVDQIVSVTYDGTQFQLRVDGSFGQPDKRYLAILSQSSTNAPTETILSNTLGVTTSWAYTSTGFYTATLSASYGGGYTARRGMGVVTATDGTVKGFWILYNSGTGTLILKTMNLAGSLADDVIVLAPVLFELYTP